MAKRGPLVVMHDSVCLERLHKKKCELVVVGTSSNEVELPLSSNKTAHKGFLFVFMVKIL